jgi:predicted GH43/DUF377 family glycosyl hydrolase
MKLNFIILFAIAVSLTIGGCKSNQEREAAARADSIKNAANSWAILPFTKLDSVNPVLGPGRGKFIDPILRAQLQWEARDVFNPAIVNRGNKIWMLYRAQDKIGTSRIGLAVSTDAVHFVRKPTPVLYPDKDDFKKLEWTGGCEDPRVVEDGKGTYYMTYTAFDGKIARLLVATSTDLIQWKKYGSVFAKTDSSKYADKWSKSGSIVSTYKNGRVVATKINGKYWMYWGDTQIWTATSEDLINWTPVKMQPGEKPPVKLRAEALNTPELKIALPTREGKFDSDLVEPGPPAILTDKGIMLIYNSRNVPSFGDKTLAEGTYAAGQALFDKNDPTKLLKRLDTYFMKPEKPYEISGQVNKVCFVEGLTIFENKWYLYYGTADSKIAVAVSPVK